MKKLPLIALLIISIFFLNALLRKNDTASEFLESLNDSQRAAAQYEFKDEQRFRWHYLPAVSFERPGISLTKLDDQQKKLVFELLKNNLSKSGYDKTLRIIDLENVLAEIEGDANRRDPEKYHIAIYGDPAEDHWGWAFQGHHVALNFTIIGDHVSFVPRFLGSNPAMIKSGPRKGERTLKREEDLGFDMINGLSDAQKVKAIIGDYVFGDIASTNAPEFSPLEPYGIKMGELNSGQKGTLMNLIKEYLALMPNDQAAHRLERLRKEDMDEIRFAYAGAFKLGANHYYRVQGKTFLIEFENSQNNANHIHSVWRDFDGDFGRDMIREHYRNSPHHK
jgi:hypothetical protein